MPRTTKGETGGGRTWVACRSSRQEQHETRSTLRRHRRRRPNRVEAVANLRKASMSRSCSASHAPLGQARSTRRACAARTHRPPRGDEPGPAKHERDSLLRSCCHCRARYRGSASTGPPPKAGPWFTASIARGRGHRSQNEGQRDLLGLGHRERLVARLVAGRHGPEAVRAGVSRGAWLRSPRWIWPLRRARRPPRWTATRRSSPRESRCDGSDLPRRVFHRPRKRPPEIRAAPPRRTIRW